MSAGDRPKAALLTIVDKLSRFSPTLESRLYFRGAVVVEVLERVRDVSLPSAIRVDQVRSSLSRDLKSVDMSALRHFRLTCPEQGQPKARSIEAFNGPLSDRNVSTPMIGASAATKCAQRPKAAARLCYSIAAARPARRRDQTRKTPAPGTICYIRDSLVTP